MFLAFVKDLNCSFVLTSKVAETFEEVLKPVEDGVYIQLRANGDIYIGEAGNVIQRQKQHLARGVDLKGLAVISFEGLDPEVRFRHETDLIAKAMERGLMLANDSKMRIAHDRLKQKAPLRLDKFKHDMDAMSIKINNEIGIEGWLRKCKQARAEMDEKDWEKYQDFVKTPGTVDLTILANRYIRRVLPEPEATYGTFWWLEVNSDARSPFISMTIQTWGVALVKCRITRATGVMSVLVEGMGEMTPEDYTACIDSGLILTVQSQLILRMGLTRQATKRGDVGRLFVL